MKKLTLAKILNLGLLLLFSSCVNNDYDINGDIDFTITFGGSEFAIPGGSTEEIKLTKVLDLENNDLIKTDENGNYYLTQTGSPSNASVSIDAFTVSKPIFDPINTTVTGFDEEIQIKPEENRELSSTIPDDFNTSFSIDGENLPSEMKKLNFVDVNLVATIHLTYSEQLMSEFECKDVKIQLPKFFVTNSGLVDANNVINLTNTPIRDVTGLTIDIPITRIDMTELPEGEGYDPATQTLLVNGEITINGDVSIWTDNLYGEQIPSDVNIQANVSITDNTLNNNDINILAVNAVVQPDINLEIDPVTFDDLPDFLSDEEVVLDLDNPAIYFNAENYTPVRAIANGTLTSIYYNGTPSQSVNFAITEENAIAGEMHYCLSQKPIEGEGLTNILIPGLSSLIEKIPDEIAIDVDANAIEEDVTIEPGREYFINTDYEVNVPFIFGPNLSVVYRDSIDGWQEDIADYELSGVLKLTADVANKIPLGVAFEAEPTTIGQYGNTITLTGVSVEVKNEEGNNIIPAGTMQAATTTSITVEMKETAEGSMARLDGLRFRAVATSENSSGAQLNEQQSIQLNNVKLKIPGGISGNFNDL